MNKFLARIFLVACSGLLLWGCASLKEGAKGVAGLSTKVLEEGRKEGVRQTFDYDYATCYGKTKNILGSIGSYIYAQDQKKGMIAIYVASDDTTPVGLFFTEEKPGMTQIEVTSPSTFAKELIAKKVFRRMSGLPDSEEEEAKAGQANVTQTQP